MKTTTAAVIGLTTVSGLRKKKDVNIYQRSLPFDVIREAYTLLILYLTLCFAGGMLISSIEKQPMINCLFECASALGTVGLSCSLTPVLGQASKAILILFMYFGRVGGLTLAYAAVRRIRSGAGKMPEEKIMVG